MKYELGGEIMKEFVGLREKTYTYLKDNNDKDKKVCHKKKTYKDCLEAAQIENKKSHLEKHKIDVDSLKEYQKEFTKNNKLTLKTQRRFRSEKHNVFTEEINKIALSSNDDKRIQSIDSIETYAHGTRNKQRSS